MSQAQSPLAVPEPWELVADGYVAEAPFSMRPFSLRAIDLLQPSSAARVVDVACGPGTLSLELAPKVAHIDALDFSPNMIEHLRQGAARLGVANIATHVGDGQALPFADSSYEHGFSLFGLMFFPDRPRGYRELLRVLKPGGSVVISSWAPADESPLMRAMFGAIAQIDPEFVAPRKSVSGLDNPQVLSGEMRDAGFVDVEVIRATNPIAFESPAALWERFQRGGAPFVLMRRRLGEERWQQRTPAAVAFLERELAGLSEVATSAWLAVGKRARE